MWIFGILDIVTAVPYAIGTARLVTSMVDKNLQARPVGHRRLHLVPGPYAWVAWAGRDGEFPTAVYITIAVLVVCLGTNAVVGILKRVRAARVDGLEPSTPRSACTDPAPAARVTGVIDPPRCVTALGSSAPGRSRPCPAARSADPGDLLGARLEDHAQNSGLRRARSS